MGGVARGHGRCGEGAPPTARQRSSEGPLRAGGERRGARGGRLRGGPSAPPPPPPPPRPTPRLEVEPFAPLLRYTRYINMALYAMLLTF